MTKPMPFEKSDIIACAILLVLLAISAFSPIAGLYLFFVIVPLFVYILFKTGIVVAISLFLAAVIAFSLGGFDLLFALLLLGIAASVVGLFFAVRSQSYKIVVAIGAFCVLAVGILFFAALVLITGNEGGDLVIEYIIKSNDPILLPFSNINWLFMSDEVRNSFEGDKLFAYADAVNKELQTGIFYHIALYAVVFGCTTMLFLKQLVSKMELERKNKYPLMRIKESFEQMQLPKWYGMLVIAPLLFFNLVTIMSKNFRLDALSQTLFMAFGIAPCGFAGMTFVVYLISLIKRYKLMKTLRVLCFVLCFACIIFVDIFAVFALFGIADSMIDTRALIKKMF